MIDAIAPVVQSLTGARMPAQASMEWLSIVPVAESRSSYNGLIVFFFIAVSASLAAYVIHRLASGAIRRAPAWDCGFPDQSPATQYTAGSFAQPIRQVFGTYVFRAREHVECRRPATSVRPGSKSSCMISPGSLSTHPSPMRFRSLATRLNQLQFLTIRRLSELCQFRACIPIAGARAMAVILDLATQGAQMLLVLLLAPLLTGLIRKLKAPSFAPPRAACPAALSRPLTALAQGSGPCGECLLAVPRDALSCVRLDLGGGGARSDLRHRPHVQLVGRPYRGHRSPRQRAIFSGARRDGCRNQFWRHRVEPRNDDRDACRTRDDHDRVHGRAPCRFDPALEVLPVSCCRRGSACGCRRGSPSSPS